MADVTRLLDALASGDRQAGDQLLPLVYDELRRLAAAHMARERPGHTLDATALVHEAYIRLVGERRGSSPPDGGDKSRRSQGFANRRHFFAAAAQAMRHILVENARRKKSQKRGGSLVRHDVGEIDLPLHTIREDLVALDEALQKLAKTDAQASELVHLRYFAGLSLLDAAEFLGVSPRTAHRLWAYARAFLYRELSA